MTPQSSISSNPRAGEHSSGRATRRSFSGRLLLLGLLLISAVFSSCTTNNKSRSSEAPKKKTIIVLYPGPLQVYDEIISGFKEGLEHEWPGGSLDIVSRHVSKDTTQFSALVSGAVSSRPDIIAPIGTMLSLEAVRNGHVPVVFLGVTDPLGDGVVKSLAHPELATGVSDRVPLAPLLALIRRATPSVKKLGLPYTPDDPPAMYSLRLLEKLAPELGFALDARPVMSKDDLGALVRDLARVNDAIVVGADNKMFDEAAHITKITLQARKPFYAGDVASVVAGAGLGVTIDYHLVGRAGALLASRVLRGEKAGTIPVTTLTDGVVLMNQTSLAKLGIQLDEAVRKQVKTVYP